MPAPSVCPLPSMADRSAPIDSSVKVRSSLHRIKVSDSTRPATRAAAPP